MPLNSVSMSIITEAHDWAAMVAAGYDLAAASGELSEWRTGQTWEQRRPLVVGLLTAPVYGAKGEELAFTLKDHPMEDLSKFPGPTALVDATTWPNADESAIGRNYPQVFGEPGLANGVRYAGSPGLVVDSSNRYLLIAGHEVAATTVYVARSEEPQTWLSASVSHRTDGRGITVATITLQTSGSAKYVAGEEYYISWSGDGGGRYDRTRTAAMRSAGEVLEFMLNESTLSVDRGRTAAASDQLRGYRIDCYIDTPVGIWQWLESQLLPVLPIAIRYAPGGLYPVIWEASLSSVAEILDADRSDVVRLGPVNTSTTLHGDLTNTIRLNYAVDALSGDYRAAYLLHGEPDRIANGENVASSRATRISVARYGVVPTDIDSDVIWDPATAAAVIYQAAIRSALPTRQVNYLCPREFAWLEEGQGVQVTDSELSLSLSFGLITEIENLTDGTVRIEVTLLDPAVID